MKKLIFSFLLPAVMVSCSKEQSCEEGCIFNYAETGSYGENVLAGTETLILTTGNYSFKADKPGTKTLKIRLELIEGNNWFYGAGTEGDWKVSAYNEATGEQEFQLKGSEGDLNFDLSQSPNPAIVGGQFYVHYYEDGNDLSRTKKVIWG